MIGNNSIGDFIRSIFPGKIDRDDVFFKALLADREKKDGTVEKMFLDFRATRERWGNPNIYTQYGEHLDKSLDFFSALNRLYAETDEDIIFRNWIVFYRLGEQLWGDYWNILHILRAYFKTKYVYIVNNTDDIKNNLLENADFEHEEAWKLEGACSYTRDARFSECLGIEFVNNGSCKQTVSLTTNRTYFLHFFLKGNIKVSISSNGKFWNKNLGEFGEWTEETCCEYFSCDDWDNCSLFFITDEQHTNITISFEFYRNSAYIDYVRLFLKHNYPSFSVIGVFNGKYTNETAALAPYRDDPVNRLDFDTFGYQAGGEADRDPAKQIDYNEASFIDNAELKEGESPVLVDGQKDIKDDGIATEQPFLDFFDETKTLAPDTPYHKDDFIPIDYDKASYWNQAFVYGAGGIRSSTSYNEIINLVKPAGVRYFTEMLIRECEESELNDE